MGSSDSNLPPTEITICKKCTHLFSKPDPRPSCQEIWYNQYCQSPEVAHKQEIDPVSGELSYVSTNAFNDKFYTDEEYPHAREINQGACPYYQPKVSNSALIQLDGILRKLGLG